MAEAVFTGFVGKGTGEKFHVPTRRDILVHHGAPEWEFTAGNPAAM